MDDERANYAGWFMSGFSSSSSSVSEVFNKTRFGLFSYNRRRRCMLNRGE